LTYLVERLEQGLLQEVDRLVDRHLAHRFQHDAGPSGSAVAVIQESTAALTRSVEGIVTRQAELWAGTLHEPERRAQATYQHMTEGLVAGVQQALERTLTLHEQRLAALEQQSLQGSAQLMQQLAGLAVAVRDTGREQQQSLVKVAEGIAAQAAILARIQEDEKNIVHLQAVLHQNLAALASASSFEEAVHSLTAAVHLLTSRAAAPAPFHLPRKAA
jgi:hypothetical protein